MARRAVHFSRSGASKVTSVAKWGYYDAPKPYVNLPTDYGVTHGEEIYTHLTCFSGQRVAETERTNGECVAAQMIHFVSDVAETNHFLNGVGGPLDVAFVNGRSSVSIVRVP